MNKDFEKAAKKQLLFCRSDPTRDHQPAASS
jgi:hypothetical protein